MPNSDEILKWGKNCLHVEAQALTQAAERLEEKSFVAAVELVLESSGRLVVTGMGKSGHVGRKISSSLASTGTASFFLHPSEALHGDLGMLQKNDILLAIAFGGETPEVLSVVAYAKRLDMKVICITGKQNSSLADLSDIVLDGSVSKEACPNNLAPTSSSTLALALGDALTVSLIYARGFEKTDFAQFHPGGSLGRSLSRVKDLMIPADQLMMINETSMFKDIISALSDGNLGIVAVKDDSNKIIGCITDGDIRRKIIEFGDKTFHICAKDFLKNTLPLTIKATALSAEAISIMEKNKITKLFVVSNDLKGEISGLVDLNALLTAKIV